MAYNTYKRKRDKDGNHKSSPTKYLNALFGGKRRREEQEAANEDFEAHMDKWDNQKMTNPYAGVKNPYANLENPYEDATVNMQAAEHAKEQSQQSMANIMQGMQASAGGSGVAGLAQVLANQGVKQAQQASISIGQQEQSNQLRASAEAGRLAQQSAEGEQERDLMERKGEAAVEQFERDKVTQQLEWSMDRKAAADQAVDDAAATRDQMLSAAVSKGFSMIPGVSDVRLKENITRTGVSESGIPIYTFNYKNDNELWSGTMAQDLIEIGREDAVTVMENGYYGVYYDRIDVNMILKN
jgi:phage gp36-like protein